MSKFGISGSPRKLEIWKFGNFEILKFGNFEILKFGNLEILEFGNLQKMQFFVKNLQISQNRICVLAILAILAKSAYPVNTPIPRNLVIRGRASPEFDGGPIFACRAPFLSFLITSISHMFSFKSRTELWPFFCELLSFGVLCWSELLGNTL